MKQVRCEHVFDCDIDTYWDKIFFDDEFNRALYVEHLGFPKWDGTILEDNERVLKRDAVIKPPALNVPKPLQKIAGGDFGYTEHGTFDRKTKRFSIDVTSNAMPDKTNIKGEVWLEKVDDKRSRRIAEFRVEVKIMMVGKIAEKMITSDIEKELGRGGKFTNQWIEKQGL